MESCSSFHEAGTLRHQVLSLSLSRRAVGATEKLIIGLPAQPTMHSRHRALSLSLCLSLFKKSMASKRTKNTHTHTHTNNNISTTLKHQSDTKNLWNMLLAAYVASKKKKKKKKRENSGNQTSLRIEAQPDGLERMAQLNAIPYNGGWPPYIFSY